MVFLWRVCCNVMSGFLGGILVKRLRLILVMFIEEMMMLLLVLWLLMFRMFLRYLCVFFVSGFLFMMICMDRCGYLMFVCWFSLRRFLMKVVLLIKMIWEK